MVAGFAGSAGFVLALAKLCTPHYTTTIPSSGYPRARVKGVGETGKAGNTGKYGTLGPPIGALPLQGQEQQNFT